MNFIKLFFVLVTISFGTTLFGQLKETVHQTFEIEDAQSINLDLAGDYEIVKWAGNTLMSKTYIELSDARPSILNFYLKDCLLYTSPSPRDLSTSRMPSSA